jgi:nucleoid DNA-binding protein
MIPYKYNKLYTLISEELNVKEDLVDDFINFYYKEVRSTLSDLNHTKVNIDGLGVFSIKPRSVDKLINRYQKTIDNSNNYSFKSYFNKKQLESKLDDLYNIQEKIRKEKEDRKNFLSEKYKKDMD